MTGKWTGNTGLNWSKIVSEKLLPCPFCGSIPIINDGGITHRYGIWCDSQDCNMSPGGDCFTEIEDAVRVWNTRAPVEESKGDKPLNPKEYRGKSIPGETLDGTPTYPPSLKDKIKERKSL